MEIYRVKQHVTINSAVEEVVKAWKDDSIFVYTVDCP
jgi:hypothetical protein